MATLEPVCIRLAIMVSLSATVTTFAGALALGCDAAGDYLPTRNHAGAATTPQSAAADPPVTPPPADWSEDGGARNPAPPDKFASSKTCGACHKTIYEQWSASMHSRALTSPFVVAQTNQVVAGPLANTKGPDPQQLCVNCHGPTATNVAASATLPFPAPALGDEGVSCTGCHQFSGVPTSGGGGISTSYQAGLSTGANYFGPFDDPVGAPHGASLGIAFQQQNLTCANCHNVNLDRNHDRRIVKGEDLVLQQTFDEYSRYRAAGGTETCTTCHMPVVSGLTSVADGLPSANGNVNATAKERVVHNHAFIGVDYPLDAPTNQFAEREALLQSAANLRVEPDTVTRASSGLTFTVSLENTSAGHNLPTGFVFARQLWLEVVVTSNGSTVFSSGRLANPSDDLCDANTVGERTNPLKRFIQGCDDGAVDDQLVNLQTKLVDQVEAARDDRNRVVVDENDEPVLVQSDRARETFLQYLTGGAVARTRPSDGTKLTTLRPFEKRSFVYTTNVATQGPLIISVRALFRTVAPYMVRALASGQPASETPQLAPLVTNVLTTVMASDSFRTQ